jgi:hypothetical protein
MPTADTSSSSSAAPAAPVQPTPYLSAPASAKRVLHLLSRLQSGCLKLQLPDGTWREFGAPASDANERAKHYRFLLTRGFSAEVVRKVVKQSGAPEEDFDA